MVNPDNLRYTKIALNNGSGAVPALGFGTLIPDPVATRTATKSALETGFRSIDASERYRNEKEVGEAMHAGCVDCDGLLATPRYCRQKSEVARQSVWQKSYWKTSEIIVNCDKRARPELAALPTKTACFSRKTRRLAPRNTRLSIRWSDTPVD